MIFIKGLIESTWHVGTINFSYHMIHSMQLVVYLDNAIPQPQYYIDVS